MISAVRFWSRGEVKAEEPANRDHSLCRLEKYYHLKRRVRSIFALIPATHPLPTARAHVVHARDTR